MVRATVIFFLFILLIISIATETIYFGIQSGELETKIVNPIKSAVITFVTQAAKIPEVIATPMPLPTLAHIDYQNDPALVRKNSFNKAINAAYMAYADGDTARVIQKGTEALSLADVNTDKAVAHYWIGLGKYRNGQIDEAKKEELQAVELYPGFAGPYVTLSAVAMDRGDFLTALTLAQKAEQYDPNYAWAYNNQGIALVELGRKEEGFEKFRKAIQLEPDSYVFKDNLTRAQNLK
jgi:tetratricopeptide (TPR) repeat protein